MDLRVVRDRSASYEVAVSTKVFRGAMHYNVRAVAQRVLQVRTHEGVVDNEERVRLPGDLADARDVDYAHQRVGRCLYPDESSILADRLFDVTRVLRVNVRELQAVIAENLFEEPIRAPVDVISRNNMVTLAQEHKYGGCCSHPAAES